MNCVEGRRRGLRGVGDFANMRTFAEFKSFLWKGQVRDGRNMERVEFEKFGVWKH